MKTIIQNGLMVNEGVTMLADIIINDDRIESILPAGKAPRDNYDNTVDATGCVVLPGVIDTHVHFREPGLTHKATIESESRAAAYGGVTSYFDMPNTNPQTTSLEALADKQTLAEKDSHVNYSFFFGATNDNVEELGKLDKTAVPGIKLFMGSSTGNMLVDKAKALEAVFAEAARLQMPVMAHCEDTDIINENTKTAKEKYGDNVPVTEHPNIRSSEACYQSSAKAAAFAKTSGAKLHIAHITTAEELTLLGGNITGEATVAHLLFCDKDYLSLGAKIKCNPAVKSAADRLALRKAIADGTLLTIGTDHAPHLLSEKEGGATKAVSGMPMLQFSLVSMLSLVDEGIITIERLAELMAHNPAKLFSVRERGFLREGYKADIVIVRKDSPWTLTTDKIVSKCGWSPLEGRTFNWQVAHTFCNGHHLLDNGILDDNYRGEAIRFKAPPQPIGFPYGRRPLRRSPIGRE